MSMSATQALEWEKNALREVLLDETPRFIIWEPVENVIVLPASSKWKATPELIYQMEKHGWQVEQRKTGGSPVPQSTGIFNLSLVYPWPSSLELSMNKTYQILIDILTQWLSKYEIVAETGEVKGAYCNGAYNLSINNKKIIGTAQRVSRTNADSNKKQTAVLAHAFILIDPNISNLVDAVNQCYLKFGFSEVFSKRAMTSLAENLGDIPVNYKKLANDLYQSTQSVIGNYLVVK